MTVIIQERKRGGRSDLICVLGKVVSNKTLEALRLFLVVATPPLQLMLQCFRLDRQTGTSWSIQYCMFSINKPLLSVSLFCSFALFSCYSIPSDKWWSWYHIYVLSVFVFVQRKNSSVGMKQVFCWCFFLNLCSFNSVDMNQRFPLCTDPALFISSEKIEEKHLAQSIS